VTPRAWWELHDPKPTRAVLARAMVVSRLWNHVDFIHEPTQGYLDARIHDRPAIDIRLYA
jgi:hypothetical protein